MNASLEALVSHGPHPTLGQHAETYGRLIGGWYGEFSAYPAGAPALRASAEVHFAWALDGRAVQDVWITPARADRSGRAPARNMYGTTLRVFDPQSESWRVLWFDPPSGTRCELEGRRQGDDVVQIGVSQTGVPIRWTISQIRPESFLWQGHILEPDGATWRLQAEFKLRRER
jgi:hypothetical protein